MKTILTNSATLTYFPLERILQMAVHEGCEIELEDAIQNYETSLIITRADKHLLLVDASATFYISKEARAYSAELKPNSPVAIGVIVTSAANRLIGNFYINFNKPKVRTRLFSNKDAAQKWLKSFLYLTEEPISIKK